MYTSTKTAVTPQWIQNFFVNYPINLPRGHTTRQINQLLEVSTQSRRFLRSSLKAYAHTNIDPLSLLKESHRLCIYATASIHEAWHSRADALIIDRWLAGTRLDNDVGLPLRQSALGIENQFWQVLFDYMNARAHNSRHKQTLAPRRSIEIGRDVAWTREKIYWNERMYYAMRNISQVRGKTVTGREALRDTLKSRNRTSKAIDVFKVCENPCN